MKTSGAPLADLKSNTWNPPLNSDHPPVPNAESATLLQVIRDEAARLLETSHGQLSPNQTQAVQRIHASATQLLRTSRQSRQQDGSDTVPAAPGPRRSSILIVDDEKNFREVLQSLLNGPGYQLTEAVDGRDAINKLDSIRPDLVLLDISLPDIDGWDVIRHIKASPHLKHVRVLALSGLPFDDGQILALKTLTWGYICKSDFSLKKVLDSVTQLLNGR